MNTDIKHLYLHLIKDNFYIFDIAYSLNGRVAIWIKPINMDKTYEHYWYEEPLVLKSIK